MDSVDMCVEEGYRAFIKSVGKGKNPYAKGTREHAAFSRGWKQAAMLCGQSGGPLSHRTSL